MRPRVTIASSAVLCLLLAGLVASAPPALRANPSAIQDVGSAAVSTVAPAVQAHASSGGRAAARDVWPKASSSLRQRLTADGKARVWSMVISEGPVAVPVGVGQVHSFRWPSGQTVTMAPLDMRAAASIAAQPAVTALRLAEPGPPSGLVLPDRSLVLPRASGQAVRQAALRAAPPWRPAPADPAQAAKARPDGSVSPPEDRPSGWFDVRKGHAGQEAWALGYRGEGVRVAVLDNAVDFAHPDLQGTWAVFPSGHRYAGWPQVFDPVVGMLAVEDASVQPAERSSQTAASGMVELAQASPVTGTVEAGRTVYNACFRPGVFGSTVGTFALGDLACNYRLPGTSKSCLVRFGNHPDSLLRTREAIAEGIDGRWAGVLLVDEATAGLYDTVYVDIDGDLDFTDEKPMTQASPVGWRDVNADGLADASAGLLYWISDGTLPFPTSWAWGLEDLVPEAGKVIGILYAGGDHGTLCASNVASRGVIGVPPEREVRFRDMPEGQPQAMNSGLAPDAEVVSVGDVYAADALFEVAWSYLAFGEDPASEVDDIQVASNSYGFSDVDNDGWDADSRLIDHLIRTYNPSLSFLVATGNGGPGYGTITAPKPTVGLGIAASTQMGSTGSDMVGNAIDSITDTTQITFGDIVSWSNRGPGADGSPGVQVAADGADASGGVPLNTSGDGAHANATWSGTSRSTPVVAGAMALVYQAFRDRTGQWPTWQEARSIIMAGARFSGYDVFTAGAGVLDSADAVRIAAGIRGVYATPPEWTAGDYRGARFPAFASMVRPGQTVTGTIRLDNPTDRDITVGLSAQTLRKIASSQASLVTKPEAQSAPGDTPDYVMALDRDAVPPDTELLVARAVFPMEEFDRDGDYSSDNRLSVAVLQHTDVNGDGVLWDDRNGNGVVNHEQLAGAFVRTGSGGAESEIPAIEGFWITRPVPPEGVSGQMAWMGNGCRGTPPVQDVAGRIALIERGGCRFVDKVASAELAGALGAVVFSDQRPAAMMFALPSGLKMPALMIEGAPGTALRDQLVQGQTVTATMGVRRTVGLDGSSPVVWTETELQRYEYMRFNADIGDRNNFAVSVHHPLQRWADGLYLAFWQFDPSTTVGAAVAGTPAAGLTSAARTLDATQVVSPTHVSLRYDYYAYRPWAALTVPPTVTIPACGSVDIEARLLVPAEAASGALQGAIFVDYDRTQPSTAYLPSAARNAALGTSPAVRQPGGLALSVSSQPAASRGRWPTSEIGLPPGGYELPFLRTVIPVNASVATDYDWTGVLHMGGQAARDADASYDNGATQGTFMWDWREESGDWRFFFLDAAAVDQPTRWLYRTTWTDEVTGTSDIDTRVFGPAPDPFSQPDVPGGEELADPDWYGPYTLDLIGRSPYLAQGSTWPFNTSSGTDEDWVSAPATGGGLHEVLLDNVLFGGHGVDLPFETEVGSARLSTEQVALTGNTCASVTITPTLALTDLVVASYGVSAPTVLTDVPATQDDPNRPASTTFRHRVALASPAGRFAVSLQGDPDDDLDLYVLFDMNRDGQLSYPGEVVGQSAQSASEEAVELPPPTAAGTYEVWVHGYTVFGEDSTFDLTLDIVSGDSLKVRAAPEAIGAGQPGAVEVCADVPAIDPAAAGGSGVLALGPAAAPELISLPVTWQREP